MVIVNDFFNSCYYKPELKYREEDAEVCKSKYHIRWSSPEPKHNLHFFNCSKAAGDSITVCSLPTASVDSATKY